MGAPNYAVAGTPTHLLHIGVNVVFDPVGGAPFKAALKSVAWGAQYLVIGFAAGDIPNIAVNLLLVRRTGTPCC
jgi:NADPH:quinone reductase-like Zn-dependent oxidoreductase